MPYQHSSEWEIFNMGRWERSLQPPLLSLMVVTVAALSSWWMLPYSFVMFKHSRHSVLKVFLDMALASSL